MIGVYCIENTINGRIYIGRSVNMCARWSGHRSRLRKGRHYNSQLQNDWDTYGEAAFIFRILETCEESQLDARERFYITQLGAFDTGYNKTLGGLGMLGYITTSETRAIMSQQRVGRKVSEETAEKIRASNRGRVFSAEHRAHLSESHKGRVPWNKGIIMPEGWVHPLKGKHHTEETRQKISAANSGKIRSRAARLATAKRIRCVETGKEYESVVDAAKEYGVTIGAISKNLTGHSKVCCNLHWVYA